MARKKRYGNPNLKRQHQNTHAKKRFLERFGIDFKKTHRHECINKIKAGTALLIEQTSNRTSVWCVYIDEFYRTFNVVYDKQRNTIVTVLPDEETVTV